MDFGVLRACGLGTNSLQTCENYCLFYYTCTGTGLSLVLGLNFHGTVNGRRCEKMGLGGKVKKIRSWVWLNQNLQINIFSQWIWTHSEKNNNKASKLLTNAAPQSNDTEAPTLGSVPPEEAGNGHGWPTGTINSPTIQRQGNYSHFYGQLIAEVAACLKDRNILSDASCVRRELLD